MNILDSNYVPASSPGRIKLGKYAFEAAWTINRETHLATLTFYEHGVHMATLGDGPYPVSFYREAKLTATAHGLIRRHEMFGGKYSMTLELSGLRVYE